jgi:hypothetical protein
MKFILFTAILAMASVANACYTCGNYKSCSYKAPYKEYHKDYVHKEGDKFLLVNNVYPTSSLIGQGNTSYTSSFQQQLLPFLDPNKYFAQEQLLQGDLDALSARRHERYTALANFTLSSQKEALILSARGQAAEAILTAAGLTTTSKGHSQAILLQRDAHGRLEVKHLDNQEKVDEGVEREAPNKNTSLVARFCGDCHGTQLSAPEGDFFLGNDPGLLDDLKTFYLDIEERVVDLKNMPPVKAKDQPTEEERKELMKEIKSWYKKK